jgi:hypothetical protein
MGFRRLVSDEEQLLVMPGEVCRCRYWNMIVLHLCSSERAIGIIQVSYRG